MKIVIIDRRRYETLCVEVRKSKKKENEKRLKR